MIQATGAGTALPMSCGNEIGDTVVAVLNVPNPTRLTVQFAATLVSAGVSIRTPSCDDPGDEIDCHFNDEFGVDDPMVVRDIEVPAGEIYLILEPNFVGQGTLFVTEEAQ